MGMIGCCICFILPALALSVDSQAVVHDVWPDVGGGFLAESLLQTPRFSEVGPSLPVPFPIWNLMDIRSSFDLRLMNSSWSGPAETNIYPKGQSVYLQVSASTGSDQELYIQSCYATSSSDPMDKFRSALILNKGCVSSKQSVIEFISRQRDSINLLLDTSRLKFSQIYIHCSVVFSSAVTPDTKSCNYNKSKSSWVELGGQTSVCKCCASKCKGPPSYGGPSKELKALVSTGPLAFKEEQHEKGEPSLSNSFNATSRVGSFTRTNQIVSGTFPSSVKKGWIAASVTVSGNSKKKVPYRSPWLSQPVVSDTVMVVSQDPGSALSLWLPELLMDVVPDPGLEMVVDIPQQNSTAKLVGVSSQDDAPTEKAHSETTSEEIHQDARDWKSLIPERVSEVYQADSPGLMNDWDLGDDAALEGFHSSEEELRGDVFMNYKWPQHYDLPDHKVHMDALTSSLLEKLPEKPQEKDDDIRVLEQMEKVVKKVKGDEFGKPEYMKKTKLTFSQASDGSSSLSYEEEERSPSVGEQEVKKSKLEMERMKVEEDGSSKKLEKDLMQSVLDLVRGLNKTMTNQ
ncbi:zona pellucida protein C [Pangasianodon hypophthalmus]|uniref:zona pellucida protein C n=1 Tax=Pangasianodon hypophthalmus TaxID=310915 RepID=UPI000EFE5CB5|nr:zona pellucida protein C [Pangasianodon hypophthalmus]